MAIEPADRLARSIIYNDAFEDDVVSQTALLCFKGNRNADGSFDESVYLIRLTDEAKLHSLGCGQAARKNERIALKREANGQTREPQAGVDRKYYCGFSSGEAQRLLAPENDNYLIELILQPEDGEDSHVSVFLRPKPERKLNANDRTEAGRLLAVAFDQTHPHVCEVDKSDDQHPIKRLGVGILIAK